MNDQIFGIGANYASIAKLYFYEIEETTEGYINLIPADDLFTRLMDMNGAIEAKPLESDYSNEFFKPGDNNVITHSFNKDAFVSIIVGEDDKRVKLVSHSYKHDENTNMDTVEEITTTMNELVGGPKFFLTVLINGNNIPSAALNITLFISHGKAIKEAKDKFLAFANCEEVEWDDISAKHATTYTTLTTIDPSDNTPFNIDVDNLSDYLETESEYIDLDENGNVVAYFNEVTGLGMIVKDASCKNDKGVFEKLYNRTLFVADDLEAFLERYEKLKTTIASPETSDDIILNYTVDEYGNILSAMGIKHDYRKETDYYSLSLKYKSMDRYAVITKMQLNINGNTVTTKAADTLLKNVVYVTNTNTAYTTTDTTAAPNAFLAPATNPSKMSSKLTL